MVCQAIGNKALWQIFPPQMLMPPTTTDTLLSTRRVILPSTKERPGITARLQRVKGKQVSIYLAIRQTCLIMLPALIMTGQAFGQFPWQKPFKPLAMTHLER